MSNLRKIVTALSTLPPDQVEKLVKAAGALRASNAAIDALAPTVLQTRKPRKPRAPKPEAPAAAAPKPFARVIDRLKAGVTRRSFTVERFFGDILSADKPYHRFTGVEFNTLSLAINANAMITGTFGVLGQNMTTATAIIAGATYATPTTTSPLDSFTGTLNEAGTPIAVITEIQLNLENGLEARFVVGSKASIRPSIGRSNCSGQITAYFENSLLLDKFINETESSIVFELPDGAGNKYVVTLPRIKYNGGQPDVDGEGPITLSMPFQALLDATTQTNIQIERVPA